MHSLITVVLHITLLEKTSSELSVQSNEYEILTKTFKGAFLLCYIERNTDKR